MLVHKVVLKLIAAASKDKARWQLNGVHVKKLGEKIRATATSGKIMAELTQKQVDEGDFPGQAVPSDAEEMILTRRFIDKVGRVVKAAGTPFREILNYFRLSLDGVCATAEVIDSDLESTKLSGNVIEGTFPDTDSIAVVPGGTRARLDLRLLLDVARLANDLAKELGAETLTLHMGEDVDKEGFASTPISLCFQSSNREIDVKLLLMPLVKS